MASFDTGWKYTTDMYLNVPHNIRVTGTATRTSSTNVRVSGTFYLQRAGSSYNYDVCKARLSNTSSWVTVKGYSQSSYTDKTADFAYDMTVGASDTTIKIQGVFAFFGNSGSSQVGGEGRTEATYPSITSNPSGLAISNIRPGIDSITATCKIDSWGVPDGSSSSYRELNVSSSGSDQLRRFQKVYGSSKTGDITANNSSEVIGGMTINPNTMYYLWEYASNGQAGVAGSYTGYSTVTLPPALTAKSAEVLSYKEIKISFTTASDGGKYAKTIQYSLDNSTWVNGATVSSGSSTSGNFTISNLSAGTNYTIYLRVKTTAGITTSGSVTARTKSVVKIIRNNGAIEALPFLIKPDGTKVELKIGVIK